MKRVYVAGPISQGDTLVNIRAAITAAEGLLRLGFTPYVPHMNAMWHYLYPKDLETWLEYDFAWLEACDCLLRLPGPSWGSDAEEQFAREHNIPVYHCVGDLIRAEEI